MPFGTGAGKGSLPRPINGDKFRSNYDNIFRKQKEIKQGKAKPTRKQDSPSEKLP
jgi:hypothetical protein